MSFCLGRGPFSTKTTSPGRIPASIIESPRTVSM